MKQFTFFFFGNDRGHQKGQTQSDQHVWTNLAHREEGTEKVEQGKPRTLCLFFSVPSTLSVTVASWLPAETAATSVGCDWKLCGNHPGAPQKSDNQQS